MNPQTGNNRTPSNSNPEMASEELVDSPLVHPSPGMVPAGVHAAILALNQALGLNVGSSGGSGTVTNGTAPATVHPPAMDSNVGSNETAARRLKDLNEDIARANVGHEDKNCGSEKYY